VVPVVSVKELLHRLNRFIEAVAKERPVPVPAEPPQAAVPPASALEAVLGGLEKASAEAKSTPVPTTSVTSLALPSVPPPIANQAASAGPAASAASKEECTVEMAMAAKERCSKCRFQGCAKCLRRFHLPRSLPRRLSQESAGSAGSAGQ
jgi:hypothetical protein